MKVEHATDKPPPNPVFVRFHAFLQTERWRQPEANAFSARGSSTALSVAAAAAAPQQKQLGSASFYAGDDQTTEHKKALRNVLASPFTPSTTPFATPSATRPLLLAARSYKSSCSARFSAARACSS